MSGTQELRAHAHLPGFRPAPSLPVSVIPRPTSPKAVLSSVSLLPGRTPVPREDLLPALCPRGDPHGDWPSSSGICSAPRSHLRKPLLLPQFGASRRHLQTPLVTPDLAVGCHAPSQRCLALLLRPGVWGESWAPSSWSGEMILSTPDKTDAKVRSESGEEVARPGDR